MALPGTGPSFTRCGTYWLQLFYVYWSKMEMTIKYFASFGTVSHDFYTHTKKKIAVLPQNGMLLIMTYYNSDCRSSPSQVLCLEKKMNSDSNLIGVAFPFPCMNECKIRLVYVLLKKMSRLYILEKGVVWSLGEDQLTLFSVGKEHFSPLF